MEIFNVFLTHTSPDYCADNSTSLFLGTFSTQKLAEERIATESERKKEYLKEVFADYGLTEIPDLKNDGSFATLTYGDEKYEYSIIACNVDDNHYETIA